jgi:hypothetical protein
MKIASEFVGEVSMPFAEINSSQLETVEISSRSLLGLGVCGTISMLTLRVGKRRPEL